MWEARSGEEGPAPGVEGGVSVAGGFFFLHIVGGIMVNVLGLVAPGGVVTGAWLESFPYSGASKAVMVNVVQALSVE